MEYRDEDKKAVAIELANELGFEIETAPTGKKDKTRLHISLFEQGDNFSERTPGYIKHDSAMKMWRALVKARLRIREIREKNQVPPETIEKIEVPRETLVAWRKEWLEANDPKDGTDCVTPFDEFLYFETQFTLPQTGEKK